MQVLLQQVALVIVDERRGATHNGALNGTANKTAIPYLRKRNFIYIAAALRADLDKAVFCELNKRLAHGLTGNVKTYRNLFLRVAFPVGSGSERYHGVRCDKFADLQAG